MSAVAKTPDEVAPSSMGSGLRLPVSKKAATMPGSATCVSASAIMLWRRSTKNTPKTAQGTAASAAAAQARHIHAPSVQGSMNQT